MKTKHIILSALLAASATLLTAVAENKLPAPKPEFKTQEQLVKWSEEKTREAAAADSASANRDSQFFYTGKPYLEETGTYAFRFRSYDPELSRWTSADPSGFPDGANNRVYAPNPLSEIDWCGLWRTGTAYSGGLVDPSDRSDRLMAAGAPAYFAAAGEPLSKRAVEHLIAGTASTIADISINAAEQSAIVSSSVFATVRNYVDGYVSAAGGSAVTLQAANNSVPLYFTGGDMGHALAHVSFTLAGTVAPYHDTELAKWFYGNSLTVAFTDPYDFALGGGWHVDVFARLQNHGWSSAFSIDGSWTVNFSGSFE